VRATAPAWFAVLMVACASNPHTVPGIPVMGDREYFTYVLLKSRAKAFNQHAAERLARSFSPDVQVRVEDTGEVLVQGQDALLSRYADLFRDNPEVAMDADSRHYRDHGCIVNDHEIITGLAELAPSNGSLTSWMRTAT